MDEKEVRDRMLEKVRALGRGGVTRLAEEFGMCRSYMTMMLKGDRPLCPLVVAKYGKEKK